MNPQLQAGEINPNKTLFEQPIICVGVSINNSNQYRILTFLVS